MPDAILLATANLHKLAELQRLIGRRRPSLAIRNYTDVLPSMDIVEDGATLAENAVIKAAAVAGATNHWTLADDTGLFVEALDGEPGVRSARYAGDAATAAENRQRLLEQLSERGVSLPTPAEFRCHLVFCDPSGAVASEARGVCRGRIIREPHGTGGFGYDTLFELVEYHRTLAELNDVATDCIGHRGRAVSRLDLSPCVRG